MHVTLSLEVKTTNIFIKFYCCRLVQLFFDFSFTKKTCFREVFSFEIRSSLRRRRDRVLLLFLCLSFSTFYCSIIYLIIKLITTSLMYHNFVFNRFLNLKYNENIFLFTNIPLSIAMFT